MDEVTMKLGLMLESAQVHQNLAQRSIERLDQHAQDLDNLVRAEIRSTLTAELQDMHLEITRAAQVLRGLRRSIAARIGAVGAVLLTLAVGIPVMLIWRQMPDAAEIAALRTQRDVLSANIVRLEQRGGRLAWRLCGERSRPCVQVDTAEPPFGEHSDFRIVKGY